MTGLQTALLTGLQTVRGSTIAAPRDDQQCDKVCLDSGELSRFREDGFIVLRGLLNGDDVDYYRGELQRKFDVSDCEWKTRRCECPDGVSKHSEFWPVIFHERLLAGIRQLIGPDAKYTRHSDLHAHRGGLGWHRDNSCREFGVGPDWDESFEPYRVLRVAIYLQSFAESGSMLGVIPGSHRREWKLLRGERRFWRCAGRLRAAKRTIKTATRQDGIPTEPGDCVIFDQRVYHSSTPMIGPKYALFLSYGGDDLHSRNHLDYFLHQRRDLQYGTLSDELASRLRERELLLPEAIPAGGIKQKEARPR